MVKKCVCVHDCLRIYVYTHTYDRSTMELFNIFKLGF